MQIPESRLAARINYGLAVDKLTVKSTLVRLGADGTSAFICVHLRSGNWNRRWTQINAEDMEIGSVANLAD